MLDEYEIKKLINNRLYLEGLIDTELYLKCNKPHISNLPYDNRYNDSEKMDVRREAINQSIEDFNSSLEENISESDNYRKQRDIVDEDYNTEEMNNKTLNNSINASREVLSDNISDIQEGMDNVTDNLSNSKIGQDIQSGELISFEDTDSTSRDEALGNISEGVEGLPDDIWYNLSNGKLGQEIEAANRILSGEEIPEEEKEDPPIVQFIKMIGRQWDEVNKELGASLGDIELTNESVSNLTDNVEVLESILVNSSVGASSPVLGTIVNLRMNLESLKGNLNNLQKLESDYQLSNDKLSSLSEERDSLDKDIARRIKESEKLSAIIDDLQVELGKIK